MHPASPATPDDPLISPFLSFSLSVPSKTKKQNGSFPPLSQVDAPFRTTSAPPSEQAQFNYQQIAWRNQTQMQMNNNSNNVPGAGGGGQAAPVPGVAGAGAGPGMAPKATGGGGAPQQGQQAQGAQQQVFRTVHRRYFFLVNMSLL